MQWCQQEIEWLPVCSPRLPASCPGELDLEAWLTQERWCISCYDAHAVGCWGGLASRPAFPCPLRSQQAATCSWTLPGILSFLQRVPWEWELVQRCQAAGVARSPVPPGVRARWPGMTGGAEHRGTKWMSRCHVTLGPAPC